MTMRTLAGLLLLGMCCVPMKSDMEEDSWEVPNTEMKVDAEIMDYYDDLQPRRKSKLSSDDLLLKHPSSDPFMGLLSDPNSRHFSYKLSDNTETSTSNASKCPDPNGKFPVLNNCNRYIQCIAGEPIHKACPSNLHYNMATKECDMPTVAQCPFVCPSNGQFPLPGDCSSYIECVFGVATLKTCEAGQHWNRHKQRCEDHNVAGCPLKCPNANGTFPYIDDCSSYILCQHGVPHLKKCPIGLFFGYGFPTCQPNQPGLCPMDFQCSTHTSRFPVLADCHMFFQCIKQGAANIHGTVSLRVCPEGLLYNPDTELCEEVSSACADQCPHPNGIFPIAGMCHHYKVCTRGVVVLHMCPSGLHFNAVAQQCDEPEKAGCVVQCKEDNTIMAIPGKCNAFAVCTDGVAVINHCPTHLHWNHLLNMCDTPSNSNCELKCRQESGLFSIPGHCEDYVSCEGGRPSLRRCPSGLHFHPHLRTCTLVHKAPCSLHCPESDGIFPVDGDCSTFMRCDHNVSNVGSCGEGHHFNPNTSQCDLPENISGSSKCPSPNGRFLLPGHQRETFLECVNNTGSLRSCSSGLKLDRVTETCGP